MSDQTLHILHVTSGIDPRQGGVSTALLAMARAQHDVGLRVTVVSTYAPDFRDDIVHQLRTAGVDVIRIGPTTRSLARHRQIKPVLRGLIGNADVVHIHGLWEEIQHQAAHVARRRGVPYVITPHGMLDPWSLSQSRLKKRLYMLLRMRHDLNRAAATHFTDEVERDLTSSLKLTAPSLVERLIIDLHEFQHLPPRGTFRAKYPELHGQDRPIVLFLGRLHHKKGLELLIPAMARVKPEDAALVIAGPDSADGYRARLEELARREGIADRTLFTGMLYGGDRVAALVDADLFALPSYQENFGVAVVESLAAGTPVVISDRVNIHRQITANSLGAVVRPGVDALAAELTRWLSDPAMRQDATRRAPAFVAREYDGGAIAGRWVDHYTRLARMAERH